MSIAMKGTLVCVVPMNRGMVISSDGRRIIDSHYRDDVRKFHLVENRTDLAFAVAGTAVCVEPRTGSVDINEWVKTARVQYDVPEVVGGYLANHAQLHVDQGLVEGLAAHCERDFANKLATVNLIEFQDHPELVYEAFLVQYRPDTKVGVVGWLLVQINAQGKITASAAPLSEFPQEIQCSCKLLGARKLASDPAFVRFAPPGFEDLCNRVCGSAIRNVSEADAVKFSRELLDTCIKVAAQSSDKHGVIGGKIYSCVIDGLDTPAGIEPAGKVRYPDVQLLPLKKAP
jgi:hypothetical protein